MSVVNVKVASLRNKLQSNFNLETLEQSLLGQMKPVAAENLEQWMKNSNNEYIGRKGIVFVNGVRFPKESSIWCNPFKIGRDGTREEVLTKYETYIRDKIEKEKLVTKLLELKGKTLGCWCKPEKCHGDILLKLIDEYSSK